MTGTHVVEECLELDQWRPRRAVWKDWREALGSRVVSKKKKEEEEEGDLLGAFFYRVYEFLFSFANPPPVIHRPLVPARYAINFVPAAAAKPVFPFTSNPSSSSSSASTDYSVVSSVNFVHPSAVTNFLGANTFVPASTFISSPYAVPRAAAVTTPVIPVAAFSTDFSVVAPAFTSSSSCIGTTQ